MSKPFNGDSEKDNIRAKIMGLGEKAGRKSYYPQLQARIQEAEVNRLEIQKKSSDLLDTLNDLEEARRKSEENEKKFRTLFESITDGIIVADTHTMRIIMNNKAAGRMLGYSVIEMLDFSLSEIHPDNNVKWLSSLIKDVRDDGVTMIEIPVKRLDGVTFCAEIRGSRLDLDGKKCLMLIMRDITEHKKAREQLAHSRKMDAIGQLASGVAHDFNNMLSGIIGAAEMLEISLDDAEELPKKLIGLIMEAAQSASELINKLLAFSRKTVTDLSAVDVHETIKAAVQLLERSIDKKIRITLGLESLKNSVLADFTQLQNVFINLGINASHAMADGGRLEFKAINTILDSNDCSALPFELIPGEYIDIKISDTGHGIPSENIEKIFDPFFTTKTAGKGTGLGLSAVYGTIRQYQGAITVTSRIGEGTVFNIFLPVSEQRSKDQAPLAEAVHGSGRIMVVDDEEMIRATAEIFLSEMGYEVILAKNGLEALELFQDENKTVDLVILDKVMPEMNGHECFNAMKKINPDVRVILSTGFINDEEFEELKKAGMHSVILKPYRYSDLSRVVAEVMNGWEKS